MRRDRSRYLIEFDWTGTFDPSAYLAAADAIRYVGSLLDGGWPEIMERNRYHALLGRDMLCEALKIDKPAPDEMIGAMAAVPLPDGTQTTAPSLYGDPLQDALLFEEKIEVPIVPWPAPPKRVLRISAHLHNDVSDFAWLAAALRRRL
jgi:isopenicillin-N epimerase